MSNWTHVAGVIRIDHIKWEDDEPELDFDELIGKECVYESDDEVWEDADANPEKYLPMGSEGSLKKSIWINPRRECVTRYTVSVFGDLRDHDNINSIIDWFKNKCNQLQSVRNACITVSNEYYGTKMVSYNPNNESFIESDIITRDN